MAPRSSTLVSLACAATIAAACTAGGDGGPPREASVPLADGRAELGQRSDGLDDLPRDAFRPDTLSPPGCQEFEGVSRFTCSKDGDRRGKCIQSVLVAESCARGCLRRMPTDDDVCMGTTTAWSCTGLQGTEQAEDGDYLLTSFGCWRDSGGIAHDDPGDNCIPACLNKATGAGLCDTAESGAECEEKLNYYTANNGRFPCLGRLRISNPDNGKAVVAAVLDAGPACWVEQQTGKAILDASVPVSLHLFGEPHGWSDWAVVHVVEVDGSTPLGPVP